MENQEVKQEEGKSCGCKHGGCCGAKALLVVLLFLVGGIIGYLMGQRCGCHQKMMCHPPMGMEMGAAPQAPKAK